MNKCKTSIVTLLVEGTYVVKTIYSQNTAHCVVIVRQSENFMARTSSRITLGQTLTISTGGSCAPHRKGSLWLNNKLTGHWGPRWWSGNTLASHLWGWGSVPVLTSSGKAGTCSCLPLVGSLQYRPWPTVCTGFLCPPNYPLQYGLYSVESDVKPQINK